MSTLTFKNLPASKKNAFIQVAVYEFACKEYHEASVSNIVRRLDIAKGSVYQYFTNKLDLFNYLTANAHNKLIAIHQFIDERSHESAADWFIERGMAYIKFAKEFSAEFELICRVHNTRDNRFSELKNQLRHKELEMIEGKLSNLIFNVNQIKELTFIVWSVMHSFLQQDTFANATNEQTLNMVTNISQTLFTPAN